VASFAQTLLDDRQRVILMVNEIQIIKVEIDGNDGIIVTFSDGTSAGYVVEELLELRPTREPVNKFSEAD
jgi:hypothetical protein